jgi:transposase InsO family protein
MHRRPRLNCFGRQLLVERLEAGWSASAVAESAGVSRATVYKWRQRYRLEGLPGLADRSCRPHSSPRRIEPEVEAHLLELRRSRKLGPHRLATLTGLARSTCYKLLRRHQLHRLDWLDRPSGRLIRRYERERPGELVHVDVKKLGRIPAGGGHRVHGRRDRTGVARGLGYDFVHSLVDDHSRLAYSEVLDDELATTCAAFLRRAFEFMSTHGIAVEAVMTDNAKNYRLSRHFQATVAQLGARQLFTPPYHPQVNGKVERFNRTLLDEWAYVRPYADNQERLALLNTWLHDYNYHRTHTALGGRPPIERVNNLCGNYN